MNGPTNISLDSVKESINLTDKYQVPGTLIELTDATLKCRGEHKFIFLINFHVLTCLLYMMRGYSPLEYLLKREVRFFMKKMS